MRTFFHTATNLFALWTVVGSVWAWFQPSAFTWLVDTKVSLPVIGELSLMAIGLGVIMQGMGVTLTLDDFRRVAKMPGSVAVGVGAQFLIMPMAGVSLAFAFDLAPELKVGLILVSCCPGGTASNVIAFLAKANLALSVLMTMCSTLLAILLTPLLTKWLAGEILEIDAVAMFRSMVTIVLLPVICGVALNHFFGKKLAPVKMVSPLISVLVIVLIVGAIIGKNKADIVEAGPKLLVAVGCLHAIGFGVGYGLVKLLRFPEDFCRTVSIEVGMQNSGLGATLARKHISLTAAAPCAISALYHCVIGSFLAAWWRRRVPDENSETAAEASDDR